MENNKQVQTIEINGVKITVEQLPTVKQQPTDASAVNYHMPAYSPQIAFIMHTLTDLMQADMAPNAVGELMFEAVQERLMDSTPIASHACEQAMSDIASACEDFANKIANIDHIFSIGYMSRRD